MRSSDPPRMVRRFRAWRCPMLPSPTIRILGRAGRELEAKRRQPVERNTEAFAVLCVAHPDLGRVRRARREQRRRETLEINLPVADLKALAVNARAVRQVKVPDQRLELAEVRRLPYAGG